MHNRRCTALCDAKDCQCMLQFRICFTYILVRFCFLHIRHCWRCAVVCRCTARRCTTRRCTDLCDAKDCQRMLQFRTCLVVILVRFCFFACARSITGRIFDSVRWAHPGVMERGRAHRKWVTKLKQRTPRHVRKDSVEAPLAQCPSCVVCVMQRRDCHCMLQFPVVIHLHLGQFPYTKIQE